MVECELCVNLYSLLHSVEKGEVQAMAVRACVRVCVCVCDEERITGFSSEEKRHPEPIVGADLWADERITAAG